MFDLTVGAFVIVGLCAFMIGFAKCGIAGSSVLVPPLMASVFPARESTGVLLPILIAGDIIAVSYYHRHARWGVILKIVPFTVVGIIAGYLTLGRITDLQLKLIMAIIVSAIVVLSFLREWGVIRDERIPKNALFAGPMGVLAGFTTMVANAAGPIMTVYLVAMGLEKEDFVGTAAWYFFMMNLFKVPFSYSLGFITPQSLLFDLKMIPFIAIGSVIGILVLKRVSPKLFRYSVLGLALVSTARMFF